MNIYDYAHGLAKAIKASSQYKQFREACDKLEKDASAREMLQDFRKNQWELEKQKLSGPEVSSQQEEKLKRMLEVISLNLTVKEYMEAEYRLSIMLADIQKIIGEAVEDLVPMDWLQQQEEQPTTRGAAKESSSSNGRAEESFQEQTHGQQETEFFSSGKMEEEKKEEQA